MLRLALSWHLCIQFSCLCTKRPCNYPVLTIPLSWHLHIKFRIQFSTFDTCIKYFCLKFDLLLQSFILNVRILTIVFLQKRLDLNTHAKLYMYRFLVLICGYKKPVYLQLECPSLPKPAIKRTYRYAEAVWLSWSSLQKFIKNQEFTSK